MSGIIGYIGDRPVIPVLIDGLKRLEYHGYDSAGLAVIVRDSVFYQKTPGRIHNLEERINSHNHAGEIHGGGYGIGHTRWATHGKPTEENAHPHCDCTNNLFVVHNGLLENFRKLKKNLSAAGHVFRTETDTEVIAHLLEKYLAQLGALEQAVIRTAQDLTGQFTFAVICRQDREKIVAIRSGPPLMVGLGEKEYFLASHGPAILPFTTTVIPMADGEVAIISKDSVSLTGLDGQPRAPKIEQLSPDGTASERGGFRHYMLKEIFEQPQAVRDTTLGRVEHASGRVAFEELEISSAELKCIKKINIIGCGTSLHAALYGKYVLEALARIPVEVDFASEFRYRNPIIGSDTLTIMISQSGETADTLLAAREAKKRNSKLLAISNVLASTLIRESHGVICTRSGLERAVASTKAFTSQLTVLMLLSLYLAQIQDRIFWDNSSAYLEKIEDLPSKLEQLIGRRAEVLTIAQELADFRGFLFLGRGPHFPLALEGALKLKEVSYLHAEAYAAGEIKHGPLAIIDPSMATVVMATHDLSDSNSMILYDKMLSSIHEVKSRDGQVVALATDGDREVPKIADHTIFIPKTLNLLAPILEALPLQLLSYYLADIRGCSIDQPRNLAKNVTTG
ncbi:MAG: glutamine--fructose-6-phosphate transaminase (isomerizing) [Acidobacteria bacterium]|nr:glutamine--fructose-6-phosphate transaminase (isomerizing) [Acidobacteriota bacterium]MBI3654994.1 glutamine--fructose-6-phosphate transaminase (isomerizing) [Acidobacteriota bacterium]